MRIDLVSDFACPWCYVGRRRLAAALAERPALPAEIHWHPFELNPDIPAGGVARERWWRERFGSPERLAGMLGQLVAVGLDLDIDFDFTAIEVQPNTRLAHELMHLAARPPPPPQRPPPDLPRQIPPRPPNEGPAHPG
ncbi:MAG: DsbA family protein, partial [Gammaproteobacteria bacterium]|nr:DsbA family protein [Gammaproteobacteria bacterium]